MKYIWVILLILVIFILQTNRIYAHQPFKIIKSPTETTINLSDASVSHAFYGEFESTDEEIIFNLNNFSDNILKFSILIPDQEPENQIEENYLPELTIEKLLNSENQSESVEELYKSNIRSTFYEPYSQMNLIRVISHQEILQNDSIVRVTLKSNGVLRYVFSVGSKEIFSSVYASGDTEYFNSSAQIAWYINPIYISEPTPTPQELNESKPTPKPGEVNENKPIQPAEEIQSTTKTPELVLEEVDSVNTTQSRINISALISGFSAIILVVVIVLITYRFKGNKNGNN